MADLTSNIIAVILVIVMVAVAWLELRVLRKRSKARRVRSARRSDELQDEAHNALITTRAIASTMAERSDVHSDEVDSMMKEAQLAYDRRNYRVAVDLTSKAKERLMALRGAQATQGDAAKLSALPASSESEEPTTKEILQKQFPANLAQSRFAISVADAAIQEAVPAGRDVATAQSLLATARSRFDAEDYGGALSTARQAERSAKGLAVATPPAPSLEPMAAANPSTVRDVPKPATNPLESSCPSCGAPMKPDDTFCRKCGARAAPANCPTCGASLLPDDAFCRKCGTRLQR